MLLLEKNKIIFKIEIYQKINNFKNIIVINKHNKRS